MQSKPGTKNGSPPPGGKSLTGRSERVQGSLAPSLAGLTAALSVFILAQWISGYYRRAGESLAYVPMAPITAILFLLATAALFFQRRRTVYPNSPTYIRVITSVIILVSLLVLAQFFKLLPTDIENTLTSAALSRKGFVIGRISPITATLFIAVSASQLISSLRSKSRMPILLADSLSLAALAAAFTIVIAYWYQSPLFYGGS